MGVVGPNPQPFGSVPPVRGLQYYYSSSSASLQVCGWDEWRSAGLEKVEDNATRDSFRFRIYTRRLRRSRELQHGPESHRTEPRQASKQTHRARGASRGWLCRSRLSPNGR
ncbi:hypothetical protein I79_005665 [Cricetulus griseus]|uniref:Uncharacterized protein n=1 Tax=Cricetulus griseus TaxID=10029 RepID=G3H5S5_CRIGR|nr:hypothetical protein I79_005665 [Cricetulus griseus]